MDPFLLKIKWKNTPLLLIVKRSGVYLGVYHAFPMVVLVAERDF